MENHFHIHPATPHDGRTTPLYALDSEYRDPPLLPKIASWYQISRFIKLAPGLCQYVRQVRGPGWQQICAHTQDTKPATFSPCSIQVTATLGKAATQTGAGDKGGRVFGVRGGSVWGTEGGFGKIYVLLKSIPTHSEGELSSV